MNALQALAAREPGTARLAEAVAAFTGALEVFRDTGAEHYVAMAERNLRRAEALLEERRNGRSAEVARGQREPPLDRAPPPTYLLAPAAGSARECNPTKSSNGTTSLPQSALPSLRDSGRCSCSWEEALNPSPIARVLSTLFKSGETRALLMGGQACILYGGAEFSRDVDLAMLASAQGLASLQRALADLRAEEVYVPELTAEALLRGHACHLRCRAPGVEGIRIDLMGRMRGVADFETLWSRRVELDLPEAGTVPVMALQDLVLAKKTQRDKDWPMIRRLLEADYHRHGADASDERVAFWLAEGRTPQILSALARAHPELAEREAARRAVLRGVRGGDRTEVDRLLREEEDRERELDRQYWAPLRAELEAWRRERR